jgi:hypothetical protein
MPRAMMPAEITEDDFINADELNVKLIILMFEFVRMAKLALFAGSRQ